LNPLTRRSLKVSREFLQVAKDIHHCYEKGDDIAECIISGSEGLIRTAISRAYYSVFLVAREAVGLMDYNDSTIHKRTIETLKEDHPDLGDMLAKLRIERNKADYNTSISISPRKLRFIMSTAEVLIRSLHENYSYTIGSYNYNGTQHKD
jgi:uncharacterized protein (UPF0332 family)